MVQLFCTDGIFDERGLNMKRKIMIACCVAVALSAAVGCATADGNGKNAETAAEQEEKSDERSAADFIGNETKAYLSISIYL